MIAFHNDPKIKQKYLDRVEAHIKADELIKGKYWENGKGCAVGCTIHSSNHKAYETELGIPQAIARLEDGIFEELPNDLAQTWPKRFLEAITVGADLSMVMPKFFVWLLVDEEWGVVKFAKTADQKESIERVADLYQAKIMGIEVDIQDWRDAATTAYANGTAYAAYASASSASAAANAAYAAASAAASATTASATASATTASAAASATTASAAASAAASATTAYATTAYANGTANAAYASARERLRVAQSEKLLELLKECK